MAIGNIKISALTDTLDNEVKGSAYFPYSDTFNPSKPDEYESRKMNLNQIASYISAFPNAKSGFGIGTCYTESGTALTVAMPDYERINDGFVAITFTYNVPAQATLNINNKGALDIYYKGTYINSDVINANDTVILSYDGEHYVVTSLGGGGGIEVEIGDEEPTAESVKLWVDEDEEPSDVINVYNKTEIDEMFTHVITSGFLLSTNESTATDTFTPVGGASITVNDETGTDEFTF